MAGELQVIVEPWGPSQDALNAAAQQAVNGTAVRSALATLAEILSFEIDTQGFRILELEH